MKPGADEARVEGRYVIHETNPSLLPLHMHGFGEANAASRTFHALR